MSETSANILLVDDDPHIAALFQAILEDCGYGVAQARDGAAALQYLADHAVDCLITDLSMPTMDGFGLIEAIRQQDTQLPIIVITGEAKTDSIDRALTLFADNFLTKPISSEELRFAVQSALARRSYRQAKPDADPGVSEPPPPPATPARPAEPARRPADTARAQVIQEFPDLVGQSRAMVRIKELITQVADKPSSVLILGESGCGKEVIARTLHNLSSRRHQMFVPVNCGAIPQELMESELFGHEKGAFTGAITSRKGRFELADGGTLFLDEIGEMSLAMQVKLLRVLQERTYERVGSNKTQRADVRIIAATHRNLEEAIEEGQFREDLYYRLNVFPIDVPPLRERREDIPLLIKRFMSRHQRDNRDAVDFTPAATETLMANEWRGNVRELENLLQRLVILYPNTTVDVPDLPDKYRPAGVPARSPFLGDNALPEDGLDLKQHLGELERNLIEQALERCDHVVAHAAEQLGMRRTTLVEKLRKYGLDKPGRVAADS